MRNIIESQAMIDGIIVNKSDDILAMKKTKADNAEILETKIDMINQEIECTKMKPADKDTKKGKM